MIASATHDSDGEFGYDFSTDDEELLLRLTSSEGCALAPRNVAPLPERSGMSPAIVSGPVKAESLHDDDAAAVAGHSYTHVSRGNRPGQPGTLPPPVSPDEGVNYPNLSQALRALEAEELLRPPTAPSDDDELDPYDDGRSPLQRFRAFPNKPLSVSDLTSGAWCELQYWYTLTRLPGGRRTRTAPMRQGSKVHQQLEDEVYTTVRIDIMTKEDGFGLRLWNLVQGLRTLRDMGLTRELEVWGMIDGNLVNGIIDSVSHENPNPEFEEELSGQESQSGRHRITLADYFPPKRAEDQGHQASPKIYLTDVKTRASSAPVSPALLRPAKIQLLLYHRFLSDMAAGKLDFFKMFRRYGLDADGRFSDSFMCQIGELHDEIFFDTPTSSAGEAKKHPYDQDEDASHDGNDTMTVETPSSSPGDGPDLLKYGSLRELVPLVRDEIKLAFPLGAASLGHMLRVQYVRRDDGRELDTHDFPVSRQALDAYLARYMGWWRGERRASGVDIEEAFKCKSCDFADSCSWRRGMDEEYVKRAQEKVRAARRGVS